MPRRRKSEDKTQTRAYSVVFADHLTGMDQGDPLYKSVKQAVDLCGSALRNVKLRVALSDKLHDCEEKMNGLSYIRRMPDNVFEHFKSLLERLTALSRERSSLLERLSRFDRALPVLESMGSRAGEALSGIRDAEAYHSALRHDISYLEGEKEDLRYEHNYLTSSVSFISKFGVGLTGMFVFAAALLCFMAVIQGADVLMYGAALIFLSVTAGVLIYVFRKRIAFDLSMNAKKQQKAIHTLNQKNAVFAFYSNFLNYSYDKYHVRSATMLQSNLKDCERYKQVAGRIDNVRSVMYQTQREIEDIMREYNIDLDRASLESFAKSMDLDNQKRVYESLAEAKTEAERQISALEQRHEEIWGLLARLREDRPAARERIENVIQTYLSEVGRILKEGAAA